MVLPSSYWQFPFLFKHRYDLVTCLKTQNFTEDMARTPLILLRWENVQDFLESDGHHRKDLTTILADEIEAFVESNNGSLYDISKPEDPASAHTSFFTGKLLPFECSSPAVSGVFPPGICSFLSGFSISDSRSASWAQLRKACVTSESSEPSEWEQDDLSDPFSALSNCGVAN